DGHAQGLALAAHRHAEELVGAAAQAALHVDLRRDARDDVEGRGLERHRDGDLLLALPRLDADREGAGLVDAPRLLVRLDAERVRAGREHARAELRDRPRRGAVDADPQVLLRRHEADGPGTGARRAATVAAGARPRVAHARRARVGRG